MKVSNVVYNRALTPFLYGMGDQELTAIIVAVAALGPKSKKNLAASIATIIPYKKRGK